MTSSCIMLTTSDGYWPGPSLYKCSWDESKHAFEPFACNCMLASYQHVPISVTAIKLDVSRSFHDMYKHMQRMSNDIYLSKTYTYLCGKLWDVISYPRPRYLLLAPMYDTYTAPKSSCVCDTYTALKSSCVCDTYTAPKSSCVCDTYTALKSSCVCDTYTAPKSSCVCDTYTAPKSSCVCDTCTAPKSPYVCDTYTAPKFVYACDTYILHQTPPMYAIHILHQSLHMYAIQIQIQIQIFYWLTKETGFANNTSKN